jgi:hypothetical protein
MALGLKDYRERKAAEEARREEAAKPKVQRFNLEKDGDSAVVRFAQEVDADAKNYTADAGIGGVHIFHQNGDDPKNGFRNQAKCSMESQGDCVPCEKVRNREVEWDQRKGWKQKEKFLINVIGGAPREVVVTENGQEKKRYFTTDVDRTTGDGEVYLLEQSTYNGIYDALAAYFLEEEVSGGTITDKFFKITRKGSKFNDTSYGVTPLKEIPKKAKDLSEFELVDVDEVLPEVPYAQQEAFYYKGLSVSNVTPSVKSEATEVASDSTGADETW